jgi:hypothetical protein
VERSEAEAIYDAGREVVVEVLLRMDRRIQRRGTYVKAPATIAPPSDRSERNPRPSTRNSGTSASDRRRSPAIPTDSVPEKPGEMQALPEVEPTGIEPVTSCLQSRRSPS